LSVGGVAIPFDLGGNRFDGGLAGGQIGFRYQIGTIVLGAEGDYSWADMNGPSCATTNLLGSSISCSANISSIASATGQFGIAYDRALFYLKGGEAWVREHNTLSQIVPAIPASADGFATQTRRGWTAGAGFEFAFSNNWSAKAEYDFISLGTRRVGYDFGGAIFSADVLEHVHLVKLGINYKFDFMNPIVARY
jgi:outer membrane immunogenic protein